MFKLASPLLVAVNIVSLGTSISSAGCLDVLKTAQPPSKPGSYEPVEFRDGQRTFLLVSGGSDFHRYKDDGRSVEERIEVLRNSPEITNPDELNNLYLNILGKDKRGRQIRRPGQLGYLNKLFYLESLVKLGRSVQIVPSWDRSSYHPDFKINGTFVELKSARMLRTTFELIESGDQHFASYRHRTPRPLGFNRWAHIAEETVKSVAFHMAVANDQLEKLKFHFFHGAWASKDAHTGRTTATEIIIDLTPYLYDGGKWSAESFLPKLRELFRRSGKETSDVWIFRSVYADHTDVLVVSGHQDSRALAPKEAYELLVTQQPRSPKTRGKLILPPLFQGTPYAEIVESEKLETQVSQVSVEDQAHWIAGITRRLVSLESAEAILMTSPQVLPFRIDTVEQTYLLGALPILPNRRSIESVIQLITSVDADLKQWRSTKPYIHLTIQMKPPGQDQAASASTMKTSFVQKIRSALIQAGDLGSLSEVTIRCGDEDLIMIDLKSLSSGTQASDWGQIPAEVR